MRIIVEAFGKAYILQFQQATVTKADEEEFERAPIDPHSTGGCIAENASDQAAVEVQHMSGAGVYPWVDSKHGDKRKMGFGSGRKE